MAPADSTRQSTERHRTRLRVLWWLAPVAALCLAVTLWPATEEGRRIEALSSTDLDEVIRAAELLAASGTSDAVGPLREARGRLLERKNEEANRDLIEFARLPYDLMIQRISDRRQSSGARRLWRALGAVNRAIALLDPQSAAAQERPTEEWERPSSEEWETRATETQPPTAEEWEARSREMEPPAAKERRAATPAEEEPPAQEQRPGGIRDDLSGTASQGRDPGPGNELDARPGNETEAENGKNPETEGGTDPETER